jgi:hypothetical protein
MIEIAILVIVLLIYICLASLNFKLGRIAQALETMARRQPAPFDSPALARLVEVELPALDAALSELADEFGAPLNIRLNRN